MKKHLFIPAALMLLLSAAAPAAGAAGVSALSVNPDFDVTLATALICVICGVLAAAVIVIAVILARKNRNN